MWAINDWDRCAPITLTADEPVTEPVVHLALAKSLTLCLIYDGGHCLMHFHTREFPGVYEHAFLLIIGMIHLLELQLLALWLACQDDR